MIPGISMVGSMLGYAPETSAGVKPVAFTQLSRITSIGGISLTQNQVDATATDDKTTKSIGGRQDTGGTFDVTFLYTPETSAEWNAMIESYNSLSGGKMMWFETYIEGSTNAFYAKAQPPKVLPSPEITNGDDAISLTVTMIINEYVGEDTAIKPTTSAS